MRSAEEFREEKEFKAVQTGGPFGGCIPARFDSPNITILSLELKSMMGSGGMDRHGRDTCMVDIAKFYLNLPWTNPVENVLLTGSGTKRIWRSDHITDGKEVLRTRQRLEYSKIFQRSAWSWR